ncbi:hypothetical protein P280DRAFT_534257 [Massarina eburnea CBS 473.64]|uniref:DUF7918 domain-containing protein n=1 Tax=Massarina eburnea CBS 473.64 TaxID=1395130 RepID=A0A6A6RLC8_9PLEO|nr:hypothetical protein P280DRAFT_534257 [Massarina eburnea CBS 473.64]
MAVHPNCPGLTVEVVANDKALEEYNDNESETQLANTVTKYVQVDEELPFGFMLHFDGLEWGFHQSKRNGFQALFYVRQTNHCLETAKQTGKCPWFKYDFFDDKSRPLARFIFKYRSLVRALVLHQGLCWLPFSLPHHGEPTRRSTPQSRSHSTALWPKSQQNGHDGHETETAREDLITLLDHYTGNQKANRWNLFDHADLKVLLSHHRNKKAKPSDTSMKRERTSNTDNFINAGGVEVIEERSVKRKCLPGKSSSIVVLD